MLKCVNHCLWLHCQHLTDIWGRSILFCDDCYVHSRIFNRILGLYTPDASSIPQSCPSKTSPDTYKITPRLRTTADQWFSTGPMSNCLVLLDQWLLMRKTLCTLYVECCVCSISHVVMCMQVICSNSRNLSWMLTWQFFSKRQVIPLLLCSLHFDEQGSIRS